MPKFYTHPDSGDTYEFLGVGLPSTAIPIGYKYLGVSKGAGKSRMEYFRLEIDPKTNDLLYQQDITVFGINYGPRHFYREVISKNIYHRIEKDFKDRMIFIEEKLNN